MTKNFKAILKNELPVVSCIFILAFIPRIMDLGSAIIADEQLWILRSKEFARALMSLNFSGTHLSGHPGVITMWLGAISIGVANILFGYNTLSELLFAAQFPFSLATSIIVVFFYYFTKKAFNPFIASISTVIFGLSPFYLAYSRIIHLDAVLSGLMILSFLGALIFLKNPDKKLWLILSAFLGGLSILAKVSGVFVIPMTALVLIAALFFNHHIQKNDFIFSAARYFSNFIIWLLIVFLVCYVFWPAMWTNPFEIFSLFIHGPGMVAHEHGQFLLGEPVDDPGALFYFLVLLFRTTPISLIFLILGILFVLLRFILRIKNIDVLEINLLLCIAYLSFFFIMMSIPGKKAGRYILPLFPAIAIISGSGIYYTFNFLSQSFNLKRIGRHPIISALVITIPFQIFFLVSVFPYFLSYYNPIAGGPKAAEKAILIGRGEGMDLVAQYLNNKANAENLIVASEFQYLLHVHFKGKVISTHVENYDPDTLKKSDYLVVYISGLQKKDLRIPPEIYDYFKNHAPEKIFTINNIKYAYIYNLKKAVM